MDLTGAAMAAGDVEAGASEGEEAAGAGSGEGGEGEDSPTLTFQE